MTLKRIITAALLVFVAGTVAWIPVKEIRANRIAQNAMEMPQPDAGSGTAGDPGETLSGPENRIVVYYFHGKIRCPTCNSIEEAAREAVHSAFKEELSAGIIAWRILNFEDPVNARFQKDFGLSFSTVVLARYSGSRIEEWTNLTQVWDLVRDREALMEYVKGEISFMKDNLLQ